MNRAHQRPRILVVDDSPGIIQMLAGILRPRYEVLFATDGPRALALAEQEEIDLILLDIIMPGMDGYEVCRRLKVQESTSHIPVLFITGAGELDGEETGLALGAADYIEKPLRPAIVHARIETHLELEALRSQNR